MAENITISESIQSFVRMAGANSEHTAQTFRIAIETHFLAFLAENSELTGDSPVADLELNHARDFAAWLAHDYRDKDGNKLAVNSRAIYLVAVKGFYRHLIQNRWLQGITQFDFNELKESLQRTAKGRVGPIEERLPDRKIVEALIEVAKNPPKIADDTKPSQKRRLLLAWRRDLAIVLALSSSGMRVGELVSIRRENLDYTDHGAWVIGKGDKKRYVQFSPEAWQAITEYLQARNDGELGAALATHPVFCQHNRQAGNKRRAISTRTVQRAFHRLADSGGIAERFHLTPHTLRHYFATKLLRSTNNLALTQDALGHASPHTTRIYAKTSRADLIDAHRRVFGDDSDSVETESDT